MHAFPFMADPVQTLLTATLQEFEKILGKGVMGEPMTVGDTTLVPVYVTTFGVGAGGGSVFGEALGGGGGGGVVPCAIVVISPNGVEIKHLQHEFVTSATNAQSQMASDLSSQYRKSKVQATTSVAPAPATTPSTTSVLAVSD
jgi:uncharacterized spore protein YtfJ